MESTEIKVYEGIINNRKEKTPKIRLTNMKIQNNVFMLVEFTIYKNHKKFVSITLKHEVERITIKSVFSNLERETSKFLVEKLEWPNNDKNFEICTMEIFKMMGNNTLNNLKIYITKEPKKIYDGNEKEKIMKRNHVNISTGEHCGQKKLFAIIRDEFYWRNMTRDIAQFVRNCGVCEQSRGN